MSKRTPNEIADEIYTLKAIKPRVPNSFFGDSNADVIDAQITALERGWDEKTVRNEFRCYRGPGEGCLDASSDKQEYLISNVIDAINWRDGDGREPSSAWIEISK
jgi:hypothetical protein